MRFISQQLTDLGIRWVIQNTEPIGSTDSSADADDDTTTYSREALVTAMRNADTVAPQSGGYPAVKGGRGRGDRRTMLLENQCVKLSLSIFSRPSNPARSVGFTSAVPGEGKTFLATVTAAALARQSHRPVTLVDCNWERPTLHASYDIPATPGLAEWLRLECDLEEIRHVVAPGLTVIPAGDTAQDAVALTGALRARGMLSLLAEPDEALIVDMPAVLTTSYGAMLSQQLDSVLLVVRAGTTWDSYIQEASFELSSSTVEGIVLNATRSRIPRWLQRML